MKRLLALIAVALLPVAVMAHVAHADGPPTLPGQQSPPTAYTTADGTVTAWRYYLWAGGPADDYHYAQVIVPAVFDPARPTPTILAVHGATATEDNIITTVGARKMLDSWLKRGWPVIATREGSTVKVNAAGAKVGSLGQWGNEPSAAGMADAWTWAKSAWTPDPHGLLIYGWSMGGTGALNAAAELDRRGEPVAAVATVDGAVNTAYNYSTSTAFARNIRAAYKLPTGTTVTSTAYDLAVNVADGGHDPVRMLTAHRPFPLRMSASAGDPTVNAANNTGLLYSTLTAAAWSAEVGYVHTSGGHCAAAHFNPADTNPFFDRALTR